MFIYSAVGLRRVWARPSLHPVFTHHLPSLAVWPCSWCLLLQCLSYHWPQETSRFTPQIVNFCPFTSSKRTRHPGGTAPACWFRTPQVSPEGFALWPGKKHDSWYFASGCSLYNWNLDLVLLSGFVIICPLNFKRPPWWWSPGFYFTLQSFSILNSIQCQCLVHYLMMIFSLYQQVLIFLTSSTTWSLRTSKWRWWNKAVTWPPLPTALPST